MSCILIIYSILDLTPPYYFSVSSPYRKLDPISPTTIPLVCYPYLIFLIFPNCTVYCLEECAGIPKWENLSNCRKYTTFVRSWNWNSQASRKGGGGWFSPYFLHAAKFYFSLKKIHFFLYYFFLVTYFIYVRPKRFFVS